MRKGDEAKVRSNVLNIRVLDNILRKKGSFRNKAKTKICFCRCLLSFPLDLSSVFLLPFLHDPFR